MAFLVEFAIVWHVCLGYDAKDTAAINDDCAVEKFTLKPERRTNQEDCREFTAGFNNLCDSVDYGIEQGLLVKEIVGHVGRKAQFWK